MRRSERNTPCRWSAGPSFTLDQLCEGSDRRRLCRQASLGTLFVNAANWGATLDRAYQAEFANGANLMTITGGHNLDALCYCLGEFRDCRRSP